MHRPDPTTESTVMLSNTVADLNTSSFPDFNPADPYIMTARYVLVATLAVSWLMPAIASDLVN